MQPDNSYRILSFNLRVAWGKTDGINCFANRAPLVKKLLEDEQPDIIGFQEITDESRAYLYGILDGYDLIGCGREHNCKGERCMIAIKRDSFELLSLETLWLSDTPNVAGTKYENIDQSIYPRFILSAILKPKTSDKFFRFLNTHLDHVGKIARAKELEVIEEKFLTDGIPTALTGDFNAKPDSKEILDFSERIKTQNWHDATASLGGTFHNYTGKAFTKIDYIFTNCPYENSRVLEREPVDGICYSDHFAVATDIKL